MNTDGSSIQESKSTIAIDKQGQYTTLIKRLSLLPCFKHQPVENATVIHTGLSQPCFHVKCGDNEYIVKYLINGSHELVANKLVNEQGITAKLLYGEDNWLITEFISGELLSSCSLEENEKLNAALLLLAQCHRTPYKSARIQVEPPLEVNTVTQQDDLTLARTSELHSIISTLGVTTQRLDIPTLDIKETIVELLKSSQISCYQSKKLIEITTTSLQEIKQLTTAAGYIHQNVFCHGDANFSNIINVKNTKKEIVDADNEINRSVNTSISANKNDSALQYSAAPYKLIDFECSCIAPAQYDIAMMMAVNGIDISMTEVVTSLYSQHQQLVHQECSQLNSQFKVGEEITKNYLPLEMLPIDLSIKLVMRYYYLSLLINGAWYLSQYRQQKGAKYKVLAQQQFLLLSKKYADVDIDI